MSRLDEIRARLEEAKPLRAHLRDDLRFLLDKAERIERLLTLLRAALPHLRGEQSLAADIWVELCKG